MRQSAVCSRDARAEIGSEPRMQSLDELRERDCGRVMEGEGRAGAGCRIIIIIDLERERRKGAATRSPPRRPDMTLLLAAAACRASVGNSGEKWTKESVVSLSLSLPPMTNRHFMTVLVLRRPRPLRDVLLQPLHSSSVNCLLQCRRIADRARSLQLTPRRFIILPWPLLEMIGLRRRRRRRRGAVDTLEIITIIVVVSVHRSSWRRSRVRHYKALTAAAAAAAAAATR